MGGLFACGLLGGSQVGGVLGLGVGQAAGAEVGLGVVGDLFLAVPTKAETDLKSQTEVGGKGRPAAGGGVGSEGPSAVKTHIKGCVAAGGKTCAEVEAERGSVGQLLVKAQRGANAGFELPAAGEWGAIAQADGNEVGHVEVGRRADGLQAEAEAEVLPIVTVVQLAK